MRDPAVRAAVADSLGMDGACLTALQETPEVWAAWEASREEAIAHGVFGTPTWVYRKILYWGQDRLIFLDAALSAS